MSFLPMGLEQRDYYQSAPRYAGGGTAGGGGMIGSRLAGCPVVKWLLIINIAVFLLEISINEAPRFPNGKPAGHDSWLWNLGFFSVETGILGGQIWRFLTFQFLHDGFAHLFGNMLGVFFFGSFVERWWGSRKFLFFYLSCGIAGALFFALLLWIPDLLPTSEAWNGMIGASAGVYGILVAVAIIAPNLKVLLYFIVPMSIRTLAIGALCFAAYVAITDGNNAGGEAAHLGGALLGFILMKNPWVLAFIDNKDKGRGVKRTIDAKEIKKPKLGPRVKINLDDSEVDRILDKVNSQGMQSLTDMEKETLKRSANK
ncbi:MAG: rhomboid family intramembrane serine protease [Akkermansiaceae bacterium]